MKTKVLIASVKSWNFRNANAFTDSYKEQYDVLLIDNPENLTMETVEAFNPDYIFFPHWSWIIPEPVYSKFRCIVFHITDLPFGRGGSPLQNLIERKIYNTKISAIAVVSELDAGPLYLKKDFNIAEGSAQQIFEEASGIIFKEMIPEIIEMDSEPEEQKGEIVKFKRRKPEDSNIINAGLDDLRDFYDFIRMLDGEGYPKAYVLIGDFKVELDSVLFNNKKLEGRFTIKQKDE